MRWAGGGSDTHAQLTEDVVICLWRVGIPSHGTLNDGQAQRPDIRLHTVGTSTRICARLSHAATGYPLRRHVALAANVGLGYRCNQISTDSKVTDFNLASGVDQNVGWFDI